MARPHDDAMPPETLDYRTPGIGPPRVQRVLDELLKAETVSNATLYARLAIGAGLTLIGPMFVALILKSVESKWSAFWFPEFWMTTFLVAIVLVPLLMWLERRSRGEFFADATCGDTSPFDSSSYGEYEIQSTKFAWTAYTEIALTGPRLLWEGIDGLRGKPQGNQATREVAASIVVDLLDADGGVPVRELLREDRPYEALVPGVRYLVQQEIAATSKRGDRVWLSTAWRNRLKTVAE